MLIHSRLSYGIHITANKVVSLVPSLTELFVFLAGTQALVGRTKFCIHPAEKVNKIPKVGGTKNPDLHLIKSLLPDLILANKEENRKEDIEELSVYTNVFLTDIEDVESALHDISMLGQVLNKSEESVMLVEQIKQEYENIVKIKALSTLYLIWKKPYMAAGLNTFINDQMQKAGLMNVITSTLSRYPVLTSADIAASDAQLVLLSSEPYPFSEIHFEEIHSLLPNARIELVDGEMFSWYGVKMLKYPAYIRRLRDYILES